jgi:hypothetical protein
MISAKEGVSLGIIVYPIVHQQYNTTAPQTT